MTKNKKTVDKAPEIEYSEINEESGIAVFEYDDTAYLPVWNETRKAYDMLLIRINVGSEQCVIERESTKYDSKHRALADVLSRYQDKFLKGRE